MKWQPNNPNKIIGREEIHKEVLLLVTPLLAILMGNQGMFPLIAHGKRRFNKWQGRKQRTTQQHGDLM
jgi:hypothetical protein